MIPRKSLLQIATLMTLVGGATALLAQRSPEKLTLAPSEVQSRQIQAGRARTSASPNRTGLILRGAVAKHTNRKTGGSSGMVTVSKVPPVRLAQDVPEEGGQRPATVQNAELSPLEAQTAARREKSAREFLTGRGFKGKEIQDDIISFLVEQENTREELAEAGRQLMPTLITQGRNATTEDEVAPLVAAYQKRLADYNTQNQKAQAALDAKISYSKKPRLQALLLLMGALDQGPRILPVWRPLRPEGVFKPRNNKPVA